MARNPKRMNRGYSLGGAVSSGSSYNSRPIHPFGPGMAEDVFGVYDDRYADEDCIEADYDYAVEEIDEEDLFDGVLQSYHFRYQGSFDLETNEEKETRLKNAIRRFETAYRKMAVYALKWHYLEEELEADPQLKKMFGDIQMMRKLKGSDRV